MDKTDTGDFRLLQKTMTLYNDGSIQPITPIKKFEPTEVREAFSFIQSNHAIGAACIEFSNDSTALSADIYSEDARFRKNRSYLLIGGLGGLGRVAAVWLAERGAGSIIFLTRSASASAANQDLISELSALGCETQIVTGSVTDAGTVERLVGNATKPIAGVLHLALVLRVRTCRSDFGNKRKINIANKNTG